MTNFKMIAAGALVAAVTATSALAADPFYKYGEVEGWKIFIDNEKQSCLIEKTDDFGNVVQMGLTKDRDVGYVGVFTNAETEIRRGDKKTVIISLDGNLYFGEATGMRGNITKGYTGGYVLSDDPQFVDDLARKYTMSVFPEQAYAFSVNLAGTYKAIELARECNKEQLS